MRDENWPIEWLKNLKDDVEHLTIMIYATKNEIKSFPLKKAREDLEDELRSGENQMISSRMVIAWLKRVRKKLESAGLRLELTAADAIDKDKPNMRIAAKRARRLAGRITSTIGLIEKALNKSGGMPM
jgi:hypothetical protein